MIAAWLRSRRCAARIAQLEEARRELSPPSHDIGASREDAIRHVPPRLVDLLRAMSRRTERIIAALDAGGDGRDEISRLHHHVIGLLREAEGRIR